MNAFKHKVLLIEDEIETSKEICGALQRLGYSVDSAHTGEEGLKKLEKNADTDILLLDINLGPGIDGFEVLQNVKGKYKYVQVVMITGDNTLATGIKCMKQGATDYIAKPFKKEEFVEKANRALKIKESELLKDIYADLIVCDIKNLLGCFQDSLQMYTKRNKDKEHPAEPLSLNIGIKQLSCLINNVNTISKYEDHSLKVHLKEFCFRDELDHELKPLFDTYKGRLSIEYRIDKAYRIITDRELLMLIFWNLLLLDYNASRDSGRVSVIIEGGKNAIEATIKYSGFTMETLHHKDVFNKYSYIMHKLEKPNPNFALGLTYCKYVTSMIGSELKAESSKDGKDTIISFTMKNMGTKLHS